MPTSTTNYGLIKPGTDDPILVGQLNDNMDTIDTVLKDHSDKIDAAALGIKYKGEVNYYAGLPNNAEIGDAYTVKYAGSSGTTPDGTEYVWGTVSGTNQWINFSKDSYTKAEVDALLALKQNALTTAQLAAVNSGIDSTKVAQIETNKNNISLLYNLIGGENVLTIDQTIPQTGINGLSYTYNADGGITISGTPTSSSSASILFLQVTYDATTVIGSYLMGGISSAAQIKIQKSTDPYTDYAVSSGNIAEIPNIVANNCAVMIRIAPTASAVNYTFYPKIIKC